MQRSEPAYHATPPSRHENRRIEADVCESRHAMTDCVIHDLMNVSDCGAGATAKRRPTNALDPCPLMDAVREWVNEIVTGGTTGALAGAVGTLFVPDAPLPLAIAGAGLVGLVTGLLNLPVK